MSQDNAPATGLDRLADTVGMDRSEVREIARQVTDNNRRLSACPGPHDFRLGEPDRPFRTKWQCSVCRGVIDNGEYIWYLRGREHERALHEANRAEAEMDTKAAASSYDHA